MLGEEDDKTHQDLEAGKDSVFEILLLVFGVRVHCFVSCLLWSAVHELGEGIVGVLCFSIKDPFDDDFDIGRSCLGERVERLHSGLVYSRGLGLLAELTRKLQCEGVIACHRPLITLW